MKPRITYSPAQTPLFELDIPVTEGWRVLGFDQILAEIPQLSSQGVILLEARASDGDLDLLKTVLCRERFVYLYPPGQESKAAEALRLGVRHVLCVTDSRRALPLLNAMLPEQNTSVCPSPPSSELWRHHSGPESKIEDIRKILRQFQEVANVGYWIYDQKGNHLIWSEQVYRIFGLEPREGYESYEGFIRYVHPEDRQSLTEAYLRHLDTGEPYRMIHRVVLDSGAVKYVRESCESTWNPQTQSWHSLGVIADITDLRQSEENMANLLKKVESLLEGQPDRIIIFRRDLRITECYPKDPSRYLVPPEKFIDHPIEEVDIPDSLKALATSAVKNVLETHTPESREYSLTVGEETAYYDARFLPFESDQVMTVIRDITKTKQLQAEQKSQNQLLEILIQTALTFLNLPAGQTDQAINESLHQLGEFVGADRFYVFSYNFAAMTTSNTHEWCAEGIEPMIDLLQDVPLEGFDEWLNHHLQGETYYIPDVPGMDPGDPVFNILEPQGIKTLLSMPLIQDEKCVGFIGLDYVCNFHAITPWEEKLLKVFAEMLSNINNRNRLLKQITDNRNFLNDIIQNSPSVIYTKNERGQYTLLNRQWSQFTGLDEKDCLGKTDGELLRHSRQSIDLFNREYESSNPSVSQFEEWIELEGERHYFLTTEFPLRSSTSQQGLAGIRTEITELKKLEEERMARRSAEIELEQKNLFLAKMSHEVRTPLSAIIGFSRRLINFPGVPLEVLNKIMIIYRSGETMLCMINNMLNYAKNQDEKLCANIVEFSLQMLLGDLEEVLRFRTNERGLNLVFQVEESLPGSLRGDPVMLNQICLNLLTNAVNFTSQGFISLEVKADHYTDSSIWIRFSVEDSGCGIAPEDRNLIFNEFFQGEAGKKIGGTGLGLSISSHLVRMLDGEGIELVRTGPEGSLFRFCLPFELTGERGAHPAPTGFREKQPAKFPQPCFSENVSPDSISPELRSRLIRHVEAGEMPDFRAWVKNDTSLSDDLRCRLLQLASQYDYRALRQLLQPSDTKN